MRSDILKRARASAAPMILAGAFCGACNIDIDQTHPDSLVPVARCVQPDGGALLEIDVQAFNAIGAPLDGALVDWDILPADAGFSFATRDVRTGVHRIAGVGGGAGTATAMVGGIATANVAVDPAAARDADAFVVAFARTELFPHASVLIPRAGSACTAADAGTTVDGGVGAEAGAVQ